MNQTSARSAAILRAVKFAHTVVWAFFAGCIVAIPVFAWQRRFGVVASLTAAVLVEIVVLILNQWRCPLTLVAAQFTDERQGNFDIYLPNWLARHNKTVFGWLFLLSLLFSIARWQGWL
jgi:hypothetical protein